MTVRHIRDEDSEDTFDIEGVRVLRETDAALCCIGEARVERWVPKSVVHDDSFVYQAGQHGTLTVKLWWAQKNGWAE